MKIDDYATRLGQLMMFIPMFDVRIFYRFFYFFKIHYFCITDELILQRSKDMKEHFEVLNLLGIIPSDSFTYQLQKSAIE